MKNTKAKVSVASSGRKLLVFVSAGDSRPEEGQGLKGPDSLCGTNNNPWAKEEACKSGRGNSGVQASPRLSKSVWSLVDVERPAVMQWPPVELAISTTESQCVPRLSFVVVL